MNYFKNIIYLFTFIGLIGCRQFPPFLDKKSTNEVAILTGYQLNDGFITIQTVGHGCTFFNSFKVEVADRKTNTLEVVRTQPDECRMKPRNVSLQYSFKHLGLDLNRNVQVKNPINHSISTQSIKNKK